MVRPVVIFRNFFCKFAAHLYIGMLLNYLFMPPEWYYYDYGLISALPMMVLNCCDFWAQFFAFEANFYIHASGLFLLKLVLFSLPAAGL